MKVLLVGKSSTQGGAAIASYRLMESLRESGVDVNMLVQEKYDEDPSVFFTTHTVLKRWLNFLRFVLERLRFLPLEKNREVRFLFSPANSGESLKRNQHVREADIIHLNWVNGGFLSLASLKGLLDLGKPVVWTFHDMWAMTGGCHHALDCEGYKRDCGNCPYLKRPGGNDLSHRIWRKKERIFRNRNIAVVTPSRWMMDCVRESSLFGNKEVLTIPNPVDQSRFKPVDREAACSQLGLDPAKRYILFGAASVRNLYKGFSYFQEAIKIMCQDPQDVEGVEIIIFGKSGGDEARLLPLNVHTVDYIDSMETMVDLYAAARLYVSSSLQDNFPGTIAEAMLCGTPVAAFSTGGIPEMISHLEDGYLARHKDAMDLAEGMRWILSSEPYQELSDRVRNAAAQRFSRERAAEAHVKLYKKLLNE